MVAGARRPQARNVRSRVAALRRARGEGPVLGPVIEREHEDSDGENEAGSGGYVEELVDEMVGREEAKVGGKVGTKKLKRIQEKAERKAMREVLLYSVHLIVSGVECAWCDIQQEEAMREDRKHREALRNEERKRELEEEKLRLRKEVGSIA